MNMTDARHHRAHAGGPETRIVFVEVPVAGSPKSVKGVKPGQYPRNAPTHWQPRTRPPSKAQRIVNFLDSIARSDAAAREFMQERREASQRHAR
jgi:hypothetical protein